MKNSKRLISWIAMFALLFTMAPIPGHSVEVDDQNNAGIWNGVGDSVVTDGNTVTNGRMYYSETINLHTDGVKINFTINEIPAYKNDTGEDGWIGLYISDCAASADKYGNFNGNNGFQFLFRGLSATTDEGANKIQAEMSVWANNNFPKGEVASTKPAVGEHELILYSAGKSGNLDNWVAIFDGKAFTPDAEGFTFNPAYISIGMNTLSGQTGSITINSISAYEDNKQEAETEPLPEGSWLRVEDNEAVGSNTITNDKVYFSELLNIHETGLMIDFTVHEVPAYENDTGEDGWIGIFLSHSYGSPEGGGSWGGNDGFQFLFRGLTQDSNSKEQCRVEMSAYSSWKNFPKGNVSSANSAVGKHQLIIYSAGKFGNLDTWVVLFDGKAFTPDVEGFDFSKAILSIGVNNPVEGSTGSITIDQISSYKLSDGGGDVEVINPFSAAYETPVNLNEGMAQVILDVSQVAGYHSTDAAVLQGEEGGKDTWFTVTFGQSMDDAYCWGTAGAKTIAFMTRAHSPGNFYGQNWCNGNNPGMVGTIAVPDGKLVYWLEATDEGVKLYLNGLIVVETSDITLADFPDGKCYVSISEHYGGGTKAWKYTVDGPSLFNRDTSAITGEWTTAAELIGLQSNIVTMTENDKGIQLNYNNVGSYSLASQAVYTVPVEVSTSFTIKFRIDQPMGYHGMIGAPDVAYIFALTEHPGGWDLNDATGSKSVYMYVRPESEYFLTGNVGMQFGTINGFNLSQQHSADTSVSTVMRQRPISYVQELRVEVDEYGSYTMFLNDIEVTDTTSLGILASTDPSMFQDGKAYLSITAHNGTGEVQNGQITIVEINGVRFTDVEDEPWEELKEPEVLDPKFFNNINSELVAKDWDIWIGSNIITLNNDFTVGSFLESMYVGIGCELVLLDKNGNEITDENVNMSDVYKVKFIRIGQVTDTYTIFINDLP